jgi:NAD(P)-dependent dehydrogenase (short-subunit alcohol dehydrogenase family)
MSLPSQPRAVVTGAGSGLGRALSVELGRRQGRVVVSDVNRESAEETAELVRNEGGEARVVLCDVTKPEEVERLAQETEAVLSVVDLVVNNAGVASAGAIGEMALADWKFVLDVNLWGVIHGCHAFVPRLRKQGAGHILNIASAAGLVSAPYMAPYNASKAAVVALSETLYVELQPAGIGVTVACPMFFRTNIASSAKVTSGTVAGLGEMARKLVDGSKVEPAEVAQKLLKSVEQGEFYSLPIASGNWLWKLKRLAPESFVKGGPRLQAQVLNRLGFKKSKPA